MQQHVRPFLPVGRIFSASLWLIPFSQGMKIMLAGATLLI